MLQLSNEFQKLSKQFPKSLSHDMCIEVNAPLSESYNIDFHAGDSWLSCYCTPSVPPKDAFVR